MPTSVVNKFPKDELQKVNAHAIKDYTNDESEAFRLLSAEGLFEEYAQFGARPCARSGTVRHVSQGARPALAGGRRQGDAVALPRGYDPT